MRTALMVLALATAQTPAPAPAPAAAAVEVPVLNAKLGGCSADFTVKTAAGAPIYDATIHVRVRYGTLGIKRMDLEVGTNSDGLARIAGLPDKARPLTYDITKGDRKATVDQDVEKTCAAKLAVVLK